MCFGIAQMCLEKNMIRKSIFASCTLYYSILNYFTGLGAA